MHEWIAAREERLREFFELSPATELISREEAESLDLPDAVAARLARYNIEWHIIPAKSAVSIEGDDYRARLYPMLRLEPQHDYRRTGSYQAVRSSHCRHQGRIIGIETTAKPRYLPGNRQYYGTPYGFDERADPLAPWLCRSSFLSCTRQLTGTRFGHNYASLRQLVNLIDGEWRAQGMLPEGYRVTICPPVIFNLIGTVFHKEWSETESLELGFYRDEHDNAKCYAVGSNAPGDFSYIREIGTDADWTLLGFRIALVPGGS